MDRTRIVTVVLGLLWAASGCSQFSGSRWQTALRPPDQDHVAGNDTSDPWVAAAGQEARYGYPKEKVNDPLGLRKFTMSKKARDIEANFGIVE